MTEQAYLREIDDLKKELLMHKNEIQNLKTENLRLQKMINDTLQKEHEEEPVKIDISEVPNDKDTLKTENEMLKAVIENLPVGIGITDDNGNTLSLNKAALKIHGFQSEEEMFSPFVKYTEEFELRYSDDKVIPIGEWPSSRALRGDFVCDYELKLVRKRKNIVRIINYTAVPVKDDAGELMLIVFSMNDITELRRTEAELAKERELFQSIVDNIPIMLTIYDPSFQGFKFNKETKRLLGYTEEEASEGDFLARTYPETEERERVTRFMKSLQPGWQEFTVTAKNGTRIISSWANILLTNGVQIGIGIDIRERKKAENDLRENQQRFQAIFNNAAIGIVEVNTHGHFVYANKRICEILGYTHEELLAKTIQEITDPEDSELSNSYFQRMISGELNMFHYEKRYLKKDGTPLWVYVSVSVIYDEKGNLITSIGTIEDISDRKKVEQELRDNERRLQGIFNNAAIGIVEMDAEDRFTFVNESMSRILGYTREELIGRKKIDITVPEDREHTRVLHQDLHKGISDIINYEKRYIRSDCSKIWVRVSISALRDIKGKYKGSIGTIEDISERKKVEEALSESEAMFSTMFESTPVGISLAYSDGPLFNVNKAWLELTGFESREEVLGKTLTDIGIAGITDQEKQILDEFHEQGVIRNAEFTFLNNKGIQQTVSLNIDLIHLHDKQFILTTVEDITEQKKIEDEIKKKNEELTSFIYTVSHDLKSPLVTIKSFAGFLESDIEEDDQEAIAKDMGYIRNAADKMGKLLDELLELSRIGRKEESKEEVPLREIAQSALDLVAGRIANRNVQVRFSGPDVMLYGFSQRLIQLYQNLLDNAVKFMGDQPEPLIEIGTFIDKEKVVLFVRDNGSGIDPRYHHKIFGLFEKLDNKSEGTGIGLALIKRIVEVHGGSIWFTSEDLGKGTTFYFTLERTYVIKN